jgi:hypothetical protein
MQLASAGNTAGVTIAGNDASLGNNYYINSSNAITYATTGTVTYLSMFNGQFRFYNAPSGTVNTTATLTQAMTLDASGDLMLKATNPIFSASNRGNITVGGSASSLLFLGTGSTTGTYLAHYQSTGGVEFWNGANGPMVFATNNTERARIDSSGNLLVGTTSQLFGAASARLNVDSGTLGTATFKTSGGATQATLYAFNSATTGDNAFISFGTEATWTARGGITYNRAGGLVAYNTTSDYRAKDISGPVTGSGALIDSIPVYMGTMKGATQERPMFIAHETPAYAHTGEKDAVDADGNPVYQQMDASALIPVMWAEIQSLRQRLSAANL